MSTATEGLDVAAAIQKLQAEQSDYVAIGNSMIFTRLGMSPDEMDDLTRRRFSFILRGGSTPAAWYLTLKHVVAPSGVHPKLVFFFFRDTELTDPPSPDARPATQNASHPNSLPGPQAPTPQRYCAGAFDLLAGYLWGPRGLYDCSTRTSGMQRRIIDIAMKAGGQRSRTWSRQVLSDRFSLDHLRSDVPSDMAKAGADYDEPTDSYKSPDSSYSAPDDSILPPLFMQAAREHGFKLLFFRVKRRPEAEGGTVAAEPPEMHGYMQRLQHWIEERGGLFYDESRDPAIRLEAYNDGDHISEEHRGWYRKYFWQRMSSIFP